MPLCIGLAILFISWFQSYPVSVDSSGDYLFNHISPLYWISLPVLLGTLSVVAAKSKKATLKWIAVLGVVTSMYSISYFHYLLPGSDSHYVLGQAEYFIASGDLNPSGAGHSYFQWPLLYTLCSMATNLMGLELMHFEFILYAVIGFLYVTSLYGYFSRIDKDSSYVAVIAFFILSPRMLNYQFAPFSLAIGLLFLLFMIESCGTTSRNTMVATLIIFASMTLIHPFVPVFFSLYMVVKYALSKEKRYVTLFMLTSIIYLTVLVFYTSYFPRAVRHLVMRGREYSQFVETFTVEPVNPIDAVAQTLASTVLIATAMISSLGSMILLLGRKLRHTDHAILISGILYAAAGALIPIFGLRTLCEIAIPLSFGATFFLKTRFKKYYTVFFLVLVILSTFVTLHESFSWKWFQTRDDYRSANFFVEFYDLSDGERILSHVTVAGYIQPKIGTSAVFDDGYRFPPDLETYDCIVYTAGLEKSLLMWNYSVETENHKMEENFNIIFNSGSSFIATNMNASSHG